MPALVLALVRGHLAGGGEGEAAAGANAVEVVGGLAVHAALVLALLVLVKLLEAILGVGVVLDVVALVLLDVAFVLEGERAAGTPGWDTGSLSRGHAGLGGGPAVLPPRLQEGRASNGGPRDAKALPRSSPHSCSYLLP